MRRHSGGAFTQILTDPVYTEQDYTSRLTLVVLNLGKRHSER